MSSEPPQRQPTPEERLFKIIQEGKASEDKEDTILSAPASAVVDLPMVLPSLKKMLGETAAPAGEVHEKKAKRAMSVLNDPALMRGFGEKFFTIRTANRALLTCLITLSVYFIAIQFLWRESLGEAFIQKVNSIGVPSVRAVSSVLSVDDLNRDLGDIRKRNLFQPWRAPDPESQPAQALSQGSAASPLSSAIGHLKLTGIYLSDKPEALIEAADEKKTYAVSTGSQLKGLKVKEIRADGVVVTDGQNETMLR